MAIKAVSMGDNRYVVHQISNTLFKIPGHKLKLYVLSRDPDSSIYISLVCAHKSFIQTNEVSI